MIRTSSAALALAMALAGHSAQAEQITRQFSYENRSFLGFDKTLGTLDKVETEISLAADFAFTLPGRSDADYAEGFIRFGSSMHIVFPNFDETGKEALRFFVFGYDLVQVDPLSGDTLTTGSVTGDVSRTYPIASLPYTKEFVSRYVTDDYIVVEPDTPVLSERNFALVTYRSGGDTIGTDSIHDFTTTALIYSGTVRYFYTPFAAVPEPSVWALLILGFGATGVALRRRRRSGSHLLSA